MAKTAQPFYIVSPDARATSFSNLMQSGDLATMKQIAQRGDAWVADKANHDHPDFQDEKHKLDLLKAQIAKSEGEMA